MAIRISTLVLEKVVATYVALIIIIIIITIIIITIIIIIIIIIGLWETMPSTSATTGQLAHLLGCIN